MFCKFLNGKIVAGPQSEPIYIDGAYAPDWYPVMIPKAKPNKVQSIIYTLVDGIVRGDIVGSSDPLSAEASIYEIKEAWKEILVYPIAATDGKVFQVDRDSRDLMSTAIVGLSNSGGSIKWRLDDNSSVTCTGEELSTYYNDLLNQMAVRGTVVDAEYQVFKAGSPSLSDIYNWKLSHSI